VRFMLGRKNVINIIWVKFILQMFKETVWAGLKWLKMMSSGMSTPIKVVAQYKA
jgi:hypothetical protein